MSIVARSPNVRVPSRSLPRAFALALLLVVGVASGACDDASVGTFGIASPALAVVSSDYTTASVSLFNPSTGRLVDSCVTSRSTLKQALSGDVALPSQAQVGGELAVIDSGSSVLTFVTPATCSVRGQLSVSTGGFKAYPHDIVTVASNKAYVTRNAKNLAATPDPSDFDDGDDILIIDPKQLTVIGRIALGDYATPGLEPASAPTQARPDHAILAGGLVYVSLNSISEDFATVGMGRVVIIDPASDAVVRTIDLPTLKDCSGLTYVSATKRLYVTCGGALGDPAQVAQSALVEVDISGVTPALARVLPASTFGTGALNLFYAAVSGEASFAATLGALEDKAAGTPASPDVFYFAPLAGGPPTKLAEGGAYELGDVVVDPASNQVFLPDANATKPRVHVFGATTGAALPASDFEPNPSAHLPPRSIGWY